MSSFHPVLGLLAVAVCISCAEGAPFLAVQKEDIPVNKLHKRDLHQSEQSAKNYGQDLRSIDEDALLAKADARGTGSGDITDESRDSEAILQSEDRSVSSEQSLSESQESEEKKPTEDDESTLDSVLETSQPEEDCDDEENKGSTSTTPSPVSVQNTFEDTIAPTQTEEPTEEDVTTKSDDGCEGEDDENEEENTPRTPPSSTESSGSDSQGEGSDENQDCEETTSTTTPETTRPSRPTTTRRPTKKPNKDNSSGSFNDSDPDGVDFSDSNSFESKGTSTELSDQLTD